MGRSHVCAPGNKVVSGQLAQLSLCFYQVKIRSRVFNYSNTKKQGNIDGAVNLMNGIALLPLAQTSH